MAFITINKQNFYHNLNQIALKTGSKEKIAIVLKDNAYGHGLELISKLCKAYGIVHAVVRNRREAEVIRPYFETILVLNDSIVKDTQCSFVINTLSDIFEAEAGASVELKVDTGMHRNGVAMNEVAEALQQIKVRKLKLAGVMTHNRSADVLSSEFFWQQKNFQKVKAEVHSAGYKEIRFHSHNSAAILRSGSFNEDIVRLGIGAYGFSEVPEIYDIPTLKPVLSLYAKKVATRKLKKGVRIGYGGDYTTSSDMTVSTYDLGYGDGWFRGTYREIPFMTAEALPILGRVSMDLISVESDKEEICIMNDAKKTAKHFATISYEITTALNPQIERKIV